ncbi:glycine--tRNA ligase subunit beta [Bacterioplanoides sp. SCSIO 12839]|uniref:glycine--tRNA ligase subunit beta n=1 Tax=Bacterioplanoides sp. SCSIO 12839 TaxID=2829569 RepID=UPI00210603A8|nr:glycine--tRNA ligase subunit beta [Bacterioplanoides sp. SCSIO 12839]UTW48300.1 glycine--tRNA ligase subunit beta [Bacterioplanoides sp. SCSIO 12839]
MSTQTNLTKSFLVELGTEELPPTQLKKLSDAFTAGIEDGLKEAGLANGIEVISFASPRRLAVVVNNLAEKQDDRDDVLWGPPANIAFDADGKPTKAAEGFAKKAGIDLSDATEENGKLKVSRRIEGKATTELLESIVQTSLDKLPIAKRMRWGSSRNEFVRPVQWLVMLFGEQVVEAEILGAKAGNQSRGHRFHANKDITINSSADYQQAMRDAFVIVDYNERKELIRQQVTAKGEEVGGVAIIDEDLLDEVTGLNEWPTALAGNFDEDFLRVPSEALVSSMKEHQKYFHVEDKEGKLKPIFITLTNIESKDPQQVIEGNEKVIRPRLADAAFFWDTDRKKTLESRYEKLDTIVWVNKLGTLKAKTDRIGALADKVATAIGADNALAQRAAKLCKTDLLTDMVYEFTDLQGIAGTYYAQGDGEHADVAAAMQEQYMPAFAGDELPATQAGLCVALADRIDSLVGLFGLGQIPTGSKDPFALRRASLGVLRILVEKEIDIDLGQLIDWALEANWETAPKAETKATLTEYMLERFSAWYKDEGISAEVFQSVRALGVTNALDINNRVQAVNSFSAMEEAQALAAANKRVSNILAKNGGEAVVADVNEALLSEDAEKVLATQVAEKQTEVQPLLADAKYKEALASLAGLRDAVDAFFDNVMVMADDEAVKNNRLALLKQLQGLFIAIADISLLQQG